MIVVYYFCRTSILGNETKISVIVRSRTMFRCSITLQWLCQGDPNDHHAVRLHTRDAVRTRNRAEVRTQQRL